MSSVFFKKISPIIATFLIIVYLSFTFTGCPSKPAEEVIEKATEEAVIKEEKEPTIEEDIDKNLEEFFNIYDSYVETSDKELILNLQSDEVYYEIIHFIGELIDAVSEKSKTTEFSTDYLLLFGEERTIIEKINEIVKQQDSIISELQERAIKITDSIKKTLAKEIVDNLIKQNSLKKEKLDLYDNLTKCIFYEALVIKSHVEGKASTLEMNIVLNKFNPPIEVFGKKLIEVKEELDVLQNEISDLKAKLDSLGP